MKNRFIILIALAALAILTALSAPSRAQLGMTATDRAPPAAALPDELTPEVIDAMLARLTDSEIRALLRDELVRRAEEQAEREAQSEAFFEDVENRLTDMATRIRERTTRWAEAIADLGSRRDQVARRLAMATHGVTGMIASAAAVVLAGVGSALLTARAIGPWRRWLRTMGSGRYWDRVVCTLTLGMAELLPIVVFVAVTRVVAAALIGPLGPLEGQVWIYHAGVSYSWAFIVLSRRAFAPDLPEIRIAPLDDYSAAHVHAILRRAVQIGAGGWVAGGLMYNLGLGFPPALVTVALAGTLVAALLEVSALRSFGRIRAAAARIFGADPESGRPPGAFGRIAVTAAPPLLAIYILAAWAYWLAHWLERGQHRLDGPVGTLVILLVLPIFDRMGLELTRSLIRGEDDAAERYRGVFRGAWRILIGIAAVLIAGRLWGADLLALAKGPGAPVWADTAFDIAVTLLIGYLVWRLILAALHTDARDPSLDEETDPSDLPSASRLDTLTPLFRNVLLGILVVIVTMIVLSAIGVDIAPLIASAGIIGIAVGFGAQTLVRDIFSGVFFLIDDAFRIGEYIELDSETRGEVESISIRSLRLRHHRGQVITIPFGELRKVTNHNRDWVIYKLSFRMEPDTDPDQVKRIVKAVGKELLAHPEHGPKFIEPLKSQGIQAIDDDSALIIRVKFKCRPRAQFVLRREIYHRLRLAFAQAGIGLARRKVEVVGADDPSDAGAALADEIVAASEPGETRP